MRLGVIADVHANLPALEACLEELDRRRVDRVVCLGDVVGYGAEPRACIELLRARGIATVRGNHDHDVASTDLQAGTGSAARVVLGWTRRELDELDRRWLGELPAHLVLDPPGVILAHGCFLNDVFFRGYVTSTMLEANLRAIAGSGGWPQVALCGHTHVPMCGWLAGDAVEERRAVASWPARASAVLVNPGSVGQPRDAEPTACCAIVDLGARTAEVLRVPYDVEAAIAALRGAGLPEELSHRLREGR